MYSEFFIAIFDYFSSLRRNLVVYEIVLPLGMSTGLFFILFEIGDLSSISDYMNNVLTLLGVLVGFSITIITILTTGTSKNIEKIKEHKTDVKIGGRTISLFELLLVNFTYSVVLEILLIIAHLITPIILSNFKLPLVIKLIGFSLLFGCFIHVLLLTLRNLVNFYLILMKKDF